MRVTRFIGAACAAVAISTAIAGSAQGAPAAGTAGEEKAFCMTRAGIFEYTGKGVTYKGRYTILKTESAADLQAHGYAEDIATGDRVVVQRSHKSFAMKLKPQYPSSDEIGQNYGSCRSGKASWYDANVRDWIKTPAVRLQLPGNPALRSYAVRSCVEPVSGGKRCTRWFVDHL